LFSDPPRDQKGTFLDGEFIPEKSLLVTENQRFDDTLFFCAFFFPLRFGWLLALCLTLWQPLPLMQTVFNPGALMP
jgi:hypothetical protein